MRTDRTRRGTKAGVTITAFGLAAVGAMLLFAPSEVSEMLTPAEADTVLLQLGGAALLGLAAMNWTARASALGGIYGRAVVTGNQVHLMIGALLLVTGGGDAARHPAYWALAGLYVAGAAFFTYLMFFSSGLRDERRT